MSRRLGRLVELYPITMGAGVPLLAGSYTPRTFELVRTVGFSSGCTELTYERR